ncbi:hypothetical protein A54_59 [Septuagintavirus sv54]|uniref:Uncharacterized protein n=1 Tax=Escherichia phage A5-4 TaxID=2996162 RepID=A0AAE9PRP1_9CAUD|nr:hypothetical protein A54_59 [Escherichia phage A5-4]
MHKLPKNFRFYRDLKLKSVLFVENLELEEFYGFEWYKGDMGEMNLENVLKFWGNDDGEGYSPTPKHKLSLVEIRQ